MQDSQIASMGGHCVFKVHSLGTMYVLIKQPLVQVGNIEKTFYIK